MSALPVTPPPPPRRPVDASRLCPACGKRVRKRSCRLCEPCRQDPAARERFGQRHVREEADVEAALGEPTSALPRTAEYLEALAGRARRREPLFHPGDEEARRERWGEDWKLWVALLPPNIGGVDAEGSGREAVNEAKAPKSRKNLRLKPREGRGRLRLHPHVRRDKAAHDEDCPNI